MIILKAWVLATSVLLAAPSAGQELRCLDRRCRYLNYNTTNNGYWINYYYEIEGKPISIRYHGPEEPYLTMECNGASVLDSAALPQVKTSLHVESLKLSNCPLPTFCSLADTMQILNVTFCKDVMKETCELEFSDLPATPPLAAKHFAGMEFIKSLKIYAQTHTSPEREFLKPLRYLKELRMFKIELPEGQFDTLPLLEIISISQSGLNRLPKAVYSSVSLKEVNVIDDVGFDAVMVPPAARQLVLVSPATALQLDKTSLLETLELRYWLDESPPVITSCAVLGEMYLTAPAMNSLPDRWLANCTRLLILRIFEANNLKTLPPTLFSHRAQLTRLTLTKGVLESLPPEFLYEVRKLEILELDANNLQTIPSNFFEYQYSLSKLDLSSNDLNTNVLDAVTLKIKWRRPSLNYLGELDLSDNPRIGDLCGKDGYSALQILTLLSKLDLSNTGVTHICRDWREKLSQLSLLDLTNTNVSKLSYNDLQFTRTVQAVVRLWGTPLTELKMTREDYNKAVNAPPSFTTLETDAEFNCDCRMYWTKRALEHARAQLSLPGLRELRCGNNTLMRDVSSEDMLCPAREECGAASLQDGCLCASRPDNDSTQNRWLVRVRCQNSSDFIQRRIYPFYPIYRAKDQATYLTQDYNYLN